MVVAVAALMAARAAPTVSVSSVAVVSKWVPVTVSWDSGAATLALTELMAGWRDPVTVNGNGLFAVPPGAVTVTVPVAAPFGTVAVSSEVDAEVIVAWVPPKLTLSLLAVGLNPVP